MTTRQIKILDTSLRDGEQTPGVNFNTQEKVQAARQLAKWGVDEIEAGFPASSKGDFEAVQAIAEALKGTNTAVTGLARCVKRDIDAAYEALKDSDNKQIHVFIATSPIHREHKLNMTKEEILDSVKEHVSYAREKFDVVQFSAEDATRTEWEYLVEVFQVAIDNGATIINVPDTVGYTTPSEFGELFRYLLENIVGSERAVFSSHCHNDLGMATANSLAAVENGAGRVEGTVNGIGERGGNAPLEEVVLAIHTRKDHYKAETNIVFEETKRTSDLISRLSGMPIPRNKPIVGANAFAHESGIHQDGVLKNPETYEIITPQLVGVAASELPLGKLSGRHAFVTRMEELGYDMSDQDLVNEMFSKFKDLADHKKTVTTNDLHGLMTGEDVESAGRYELMRVQTTLLDDGVHAATVAVVDKANDDEISIESNTGVGSVEAAYNAINRLVGHDYILRDYYVDAISKGSDSQAQVHIQIETEDGYLRNGFGVDFDVLTASVKAYLQAIE